MKNIYLKNGVMINFTVEDWLTLKAADEHFSRFDIPDQKITIGLKNLINKIEVYMSQYKYDILTNDEHVRNKLQSILDFVNYPGDVCLEDNGGALTVFTDDELDKSYKALFIAAWIKQNELIDTIKFKLKL